MQSNGNTRGLQRRLVRTRASLRPYGPYEVLGSAMDMVSWEVCGFCWSWQLEDETQRRRRIFCHVTRSWIDLMLTETQPAYEVLELTRKSRTDDLAANFIKKTNEETLLGIGKNTSIQQSLWSVRETQARKQVLVLLLIPFATTLTCITLLSWFLLFFFESFWPSIVFSIGSYLFLGSKKWSGG